MTDLELTPFQRARAAGFKPLATDPLGLTFLSRDSQRVLSAEQVVEEIEREQKEGSRHEFSVSILEA
jgi:hypothetical protein